MKKPAQKLFFWFFLPLLFVFVFSCVRKRLILLNSSRCSRWIAMFSSSELNRKAWICIHELIDKSCHSANKTVWFILKRIQVAIKRKKINQRQKRRKVMKKMWVFPRFFFWVKKFSFHDEQKDLRKKTQYSICVCVCVCERKKN